ncbi:hypothetical protein B0H11DRAFT_204863 [Mycena galericulata]|nr:hypothetical protein B0H11DRAFT_204863 [Mycena galericulata]
MYDARRLLHTKRLARLRSGLRFPDFKNGSCLGTPYVDTIVGHCFAWAAGYNGVRLPANRSPGVYSASQDAGGFLRTNWAALQCPLVTRWVPLHRNYRRHFSLRRRCPVVWVPACLPRSRPPGGPLFSNYSLWIRLHATTALPSVRMRDASTHVFLPTLFDPPIQKSPWSTLCGAVVHPRVWSWGPFEEPRRQYEPEKGN